MASPRIISRAVRNSAALVTFAVGRIDGSISTLNSPVGCSTDRVFRGLAGTTATPCATEPSITQAVATRHRAPARRWRRGRRAE